MLIIYHKDCPDGFCAALIAKRKYAEAELIGASYGEPPIATERFIGQPVVMVDFSYPRTYLVEISNAAKSLLVLDHHKTAQQDLAGLDFATFDMLRSGAGLAWDILFPGDPRPWYVNYVEDRDLWNWKLPRSREVSAYVMALPKTELAWHELDSITADEAANRGASILLHIDHYIEGIQAHKQFGEFLGLRFSVVNAPYMNISDVCNALCKDDGTQVGLGWFERGDGKIQFSLRSIGDVDVSAIAKTFGGGGHRNAAGFELPVSNGRAVLDEILGRK